MKKRKIDGKLQNVFHLLAIREDNVRNYTPPAYGAVSSPGPEEVRQNQSEKAAGKKEITTHASC